MHRDAGRDSRKLWTMKLHKQQLRVQVNQMSRSQNRQRVAPRPARVVDRCRLREDPRRRMPTWKLQRVRQHSRRVLWRKTSEINGRYAILHQTDENFNVDAHKMVVVAAMPDGKGEWTQRVIDWGGNLVDTQKVNEGRPRELANIEKLEVAEPIQLQEATPQNLEIVYRKWLDDAKGTSEDPNAVGADWLQHR